MHFFKVTIAIFYCEMEWVINVLLHQPSHLLELVVNVSLDVLKLAEQGRQVLLLRGRGQVGQGRRHRQVVPLLFLVLGAELPQKQGLRHGGRGGKLKIIIFSFRLIIL